MHLLSIAPLLALAITACSILWLYKHFTSPLRTVPGPFLARLSDAWYFLQLRKGKWETQNQELHHKYGPIVRYGPNRYSFNHVQAAPAIYGRGSSNFPKSTWYDASGDPSDPNNLFAERNMQNHNQVRRAMQNLYTMSSLVSYEPYVDECGDIFSQRLSELSTGGVAVDMAHWFQCYAFDVIGCITFSKRFGFLDRGDDIGEVMASLDGFFLYATLCGVYSWVHPYIFKLKNMLGGSTATGLGYVVGFSRERMEEHQTSPKAVSLPDEYEDEGGDEKQTQTPGKATDFLTKFFAKHIASPNTFSKQLIISGCSANVAAGSDTTGISLSAILYYLCRNPRCMEKLREEVDGFCDKQVNENEKTAAPRYITFADSQGMPYLQAVIKEALRLHPAVGLPLERVVPAGGATICGRFFPEGTIVAINSWVEHRNPDIYGPDAEQFRPERWIEEPDAGRLSLMNSHWMPFGLGSRTCIGRHISHLEISKLIPRLVREFDFEMVPQETGLKRGGEGGWHKRTYWFVKPVGFRVRVKARSR